MKYAAAQDNAPRFRKEPSVKISEDQGPKDSRKIHVSGFPLTWTNEDIEHFFQQFVPLCCPTHTQGPVEEAFVTFVNKKDFETCLETPRKQADGFEVVCAKVSLTVPEDRHKRSR